MKIWKWLKINKSLIGLFIFESILTFLYILVVSTVIMAIIYLFILSLRGFS